MCKKLIYFVCFVLVLGMVSSAYAANIIWVSDASDYDSDGALDDRGWVDLLRAEGYSVDYKGEDGSEAPDYWYWRGTLDDAKIAELNAADLVIVSRDTGSGSYNFPTQWNSVTTPLILQSVYLVRSSRWLWFETGSLEQNGGAPTLEAVDPGHPIFYSVPLGPSNQVDILDGAVGQTSFVQATDAGNGTMIAKRADNDWAFITEWDPGVEFYTGAGQTAGGRRMLFTAGRGEAAPNPVGVYNLTAEGEKVFLNAIRYMIGMPPELASNPSPVHEATDVPREVVLGWEPGEFAAPTNGHKVYLGESFDDVNDATGVVAQTAASYAPAQRLDFGKTYYWRVDEVNAPPTSHVEFKGEVWSFTTEPIGYAIEDVNATASSALLVETGPENTVNGSGIDADDLHSIEQTDMWVSGTEPNGAWIEFEFDKVYKLHEMLVWNSNQAIEYIVGFGCKGVTIEYSADGNDYTTLGTTHEFAQAPGTPGYAHNTTIDLGGVAAKNVRLTISSNWGFLPQYSLSEVRFTYIPLRAREPQPESGAIDMDVDAVLSWRAGREAAEHNVYIDTHEQAVMDGTADVTTLTEASHGPISLDLGQTYYWKVNEVNDAETPTMLEGDIWNFTTLESFVVEDFEDYNDYPGDRIYETWTDGYEIPTNGAMLGYPEPLNFAAGDHILETTDVHGGEQSLPFFYDNSTAASSEASVNIADLPIGSDWTGNGVKSLSLWFSGDVNNAPEQMYVKLNGVKVLYDSDATNLNNAGWQPWNINLTDFTGVNLSNVTGLSIGFERIGFSGGTGMVLFDDIRLYPFERQLITPTEPSTANLVGHWQFDEGSGTTAADSSGNNNHGTITGAVWVAGQVGGALSFDGANDYVFIDGSYQLPLYSVALWFRVDGGEGERNIFSAYASPGFRFGIALSLRSNGALRYLHRYPSSSGGTNIYTDTIYDDGDWYHAAMVKSADTMMLYVNGAQVGSAADSTQFTAADDPLGVALGVLDHERAPLNRLFVGAMDDIRIYDRPLSQGETSWLGGRTEPFDKPF